MPEPQRFTFTWGRDEHDPARRAETIRRAVDFIATSFAAEGAEDNSELERLLREKPEIGLDVLYVLRAITAGFVIGDAEARGEDPLEVLRGIEAALKEVSDGEG